MKIISSWRLKFDHCDTVLQRTYRVKLRERYCYMLIHNTFLLHSYIYCIHLTLIYFALRSETSVDSRNG